MQLRPKGTRIPIQDILIVTDGAPWDDIAILYGIDLAQEHAARLQVIHVVSRSLHNNIPEDSVYRLEPEEKSFITRRTVERSRFPIVLLQMLELHHFDLVIATSNRESERSGLSELMDRVLFTVDCPVHLFGPAVPANEVPRARPRTILYCTDFSQQSFNAAGHAFSWAQEHQAWLTMLHVVEGVRRSALNEAESFVEPFRHWMEELVPNEIELWSEVETRIEFGDVSEAILNTAQKIHADLIVLGANALNDVGEDAVSGKTRQVLLRSDCPVLLVRQSMSNHQSTPDERKNELVAA